MSSPSTNYVHLHTHTHTHIVTLSYQIRGQELLAVSCPGVNPTPLTSYVSHTGVFFMRNIVNITALIFVKLNKLSRNIDPTGLLQRLSIDIWICIMLCISPSVKALLCCISSLYSPVVWLCGVALHPALSVYCLAVDKERKRKRRGWQRQWFATVKISIFHPRGGLFHMKENENAVLGENRLESYFNFLSFK